MQTGVQNESAPDSPSHGTPVEQPSPENRSQSAYDAAYPVGMARMGYLRNVMTEPPRTLVVDL
jgi:hypothetical protein